MKDDCCILERIKELDRQLGQLRRASRATVPAYATSNTRGFPINAATGDNVLMPPTGPLLNVVAQSANSGTEYRVLVKGVYQILFAAQNPKVGTSLTFTITINGIPDPNTSRLKLGQVDQAPTVIIYQASLAAGDRVSVRITAATNLPQYQNIDFALEKIN